jgi:hypothetical protein
MLLLSQEIRQSLFYTWRMLPRPKSDVPSDGDGQGVDGPRKLGRMTVRTDPYATGIATHARLDISAFRVGRWPFTISKCGDRIHHIAGRGCRSSRGRPAL